LHPKDRNSPKRSEAKGKNSLDFHFLRPQTKKTTSHLSFLAALTVMAKAPNKC
jgi:hypothetical protein